ncbi:hypothetical protein ACIOKD_30805 [Streptomyces sp. NPDC087844]|uniref:hypothetical protein n=1 Tax=Streptomyces sp. NPDC087844 TaxID=3365805 RepID=UPI00381E5F2B
MGARRGPDAPCPAALLGLNGLYALPELIDGLGTLHEHLRQEYRTLLSNAFTTDDKRNWAAASPAHFDPADIAERIREGRAPRLIVRPAALFRDRHPQTVAPTGRA